VLVAELSNCGKTQVGGSAGGATQTLLTIVDGEMHTGGTELPADGGTELPADCGNVQTPFVSTSAPTHVGVETDADVVGDVAVAVLGLPPPPPPPQAVSAIATASAIEECLRVLSVDMMCLSLAYVGIISSFNQKVNQIITTDSLYACIFHGI
jgi:hypothetical protein